MNKFKYYFILIITTLSLFSCSKNNDTTETVPLHDYADQFTADNTTIEEYLKTYYITVTNNPGEADDQDVTFTKIPVGGSQPSIWSYLNSATFPKLLSREVSLHGITYKMYYLALREGTGSAPCNVDGVLASYRGQYLSETTVSNVTTITGTQFEEVKYPQQTFSLYSVVKGWSEIFPKFKTGNHIEKSDGTVGYSGFGAGIIFIPSGLGYYASGTGSIPSYAPLVFSFKLYALQRLDQDGDGVPSYLEDLNGDGYLYDFRNTVNYPTTPSTNLDNTDSDEIPDFLDTDDDGDYYLTHVEIKNPSTGLPYSFAAIPTCTSGKKNFLDSTCHP